MVDDIMSQPYQLGSHAMNAMLNDAEAKISAAVKEINRANGPQAPSPQEVVPFVELSVKLAESLVEVYSAILNEVEGKLENAKLEATRIREIANKRAAEVADLRMRLENFGSTMLEAHKSYFPEDHK